MLPVSGVAVPGGAASWTGARPARPPSQAGRVRSGGNSLPGLAPVRVLRINLSNVGSKGQNVEAQIQGGAGVGEGADGDEVNAGFRHRPGRGQPQAAAGFQAH